MKRRHFLNNSLKTACLAASFPLLASSGRFIKLGDLNLKIDRIELFRYDIKIPRHFSFGTWLNGQYLFMRILCIYSGQAWKSKNTVHQILNIEYDTSPGGLSGNDDSGHMSAWYVFAAIGFTRSARHYLNMLLLIQYSKKYPSNLVTAKCWSFRHPESRKRNDPSNPFH